MADTQQQMQKFLRRAFIALIGLVAIVAFGFSIASPSRKPAGTLALSQLLADVQAQQISHIEIQYQDAQDLFITYKNQPQRYYYTRLPANTSIVELLQEAQIPQGTVDMRVAPRPPWTGMDRILPILLPILAFIGFLIFFLRFAQKQQQKQRRTQTPEE
jgi:ATP-dependent Zn protease